jgi:hypothetical protein
VNLTCKLFFGRCLCLVPMTRAWPQDRQARTGLRHLPSDTIFCFTLGGPT